MATVRITTTRDPSLQALGTAGQTAAGSWSALRSTLASRLGDEYARLIAEPASNPTQGETDWYADFTEPVRPLATLDGPAQEAARQTLERLVGGVQALAAELRGARDESQRFLGTMLELTTQVPGEEYVYVAGTQPILVAWGHARAGAESERVFLRGTRPSQARVAAQGGVDVSTPIVILPPPRSPYALKPVSMVPRVASLAASIALLGAALFVLWRDPFHLYDADPTACAVAPGALDVRTALESAAAREGQLRLQLAQLVTDAGGKRLQCAPVQQAALPPGPPPPTPPPSRDVQRATEAGGKSGKLHIVLAWDDRNDLDLHVYCPDAHLSWHDRQACGGTLDVDANGDARVAGASPVENAFFPTPAPGAYRIAVNPYAMRVSRSSTFRVTVQQEGKPDQVFDGTAVLGAGQQDVATITVEPAP